MIVLDEPLSSLDASAQAQVSNLLKGLARELRVGLLLISHDLAIVRHIADVVAVMYLGLVVETAPTRRLWEAPLHPYTEALIEAIPRADGKGWLPEALPGEVPDPARPPAGCRLRPLRSLGQAPSGPGLERLGRAARPVCGGRQPERPGRGFDSADRGIL